LKLPESLWQAAVELVPFRIGPHRVAENTRYIENLR